jgi:hypothetical protein
LVAGWPLVVREWKRITSARPVVRQILEAMGQPVDARIAEAARIGELALAKKAQIEAAATAEQLEEIGWM